MKKCLIPWLKLSKLDVLLRKRMQKNKDNMCPYLDVMILLKHTEDGIVSQKNSLIHQLVICAYPSQKRCWCGSVANNVASTKC